MVRDWSRDHGSVTHYSKKKPPDAPRMFRGTHLRSLGRFAYHASSSRSRLTMVRYASESSLRVICSMDSAICPASAMSGIKAPYILISCVLGSSRGMGDAFFAIVSKSAGRTVGRRPRNKAQYLQPCQYSGHSPSGHRCIVLIQHHTSIHDHMPDIYVSLREANLRAVDVQAKVKCLPASDTCQELLASEIIAPGLHSLPI